jgi:hypothetical protein
MPSVAAKAKKDRKASFLSRFLIIKCDGKEQKGNYYIVDRETGWLVWKLQKPTAFLNQIFEDGFEYLGEREDTLDLRVFKHTSGYQAINLERQLLQKEITKEEYDAAMERNTSVLYGSIHTGTVGVYRIGGIITTRCKVKAEIEMVHDGETFWNYEVDLGQVGKFYVAVDK